MEIEDTIWRNLKNFKDPPYLWGYGCSDYIAIEDILATSTKINLYSRENWLMYNVINDSIANNCKRLGRKLIAINGELVK